MPLLWLSLAFLLGILASANLPLPETTWLTVSIFALLTSLASILLPRLNSRFPLHASRFTPHVSRFTPLFPYSLIPLIFALGALRCSSVRPDFADPAFIAFYNDLPAEVTVQGVLIEPPDRRDSYANLRLRLERIRTGPGAAFVPVEGFLLVNVPREIEWQYGDRLRLRGKLFTPSEESGLSYREYLANQGIYSLMPFPHVAVIQYSQGNPARDLLYRFRELVLERIYRLYPDPEASLLAGILVGVDSGISSPVKEAFQATGTSHIIAISGFNMTIIAGLFLLLSGRLLGPRRGAAAAALGIAAYTLLVGAAPAVVRAALLAGLSLLARQLGRRQHGLNSLAFVAALMALFHPPVLWDIGFQLSFMATLGLVLYAEPLSLAFNRLVANRLSPVAAQNISRPVSEYLLFTLAAQVTSLPVILYHFGRLSLTSLLANPLVLPVQPAVMTLGGLSVLLGLLWLPLGRLAAFLAWPFTAYTIRMVEFLGRIPHGELVLGSASLALVLLFYVLLFGGSFAWPRLAWVPAFLKRSLLLSGLGAATIVVWQVALAAPDGRLHLTLLDVGGGDGLLLQTPGGRTILIDGGSNPTLLSDGLGRRLPLVHRQLDWLVVGGVSKEQLSAVPGILERFPVENVLWAGTPNGSRAALALQERLSRSETPILPAQTGHVLDLGSGAELRVLSVGERGAVLLLEWENFHALLPLGMDFDILETLQKDSRRVQVEALLLADSGLASLNPPEWIGKLRPQVVLLSAGQTQPDPETLQAVAGYTLLRTDRNGWIELNTDGESMWGEVERR